MRSVLWSGLVLCTVFWMGCSSGRETGGESAGQEPEIKRIPVILDTDIGSDIDDTWAVALLLNCAELDPRLIVTASGDTRARARLAARFLEVAGRADIPVGIGRFEGEEDLPQAPWVGDYELDRYPGTIYEDGIEAMLQCIRESPAPVVLVVLGPATNIAAALARDPSIVDKARVVAMSGSVDVGYDGKPEPEPEYNVRRDRGATRAMYEAGWDVLLAPLDTAGTIRLEGERYRRVVVSQKPEIRALLENYRIWASRVDWTQVDPDVGSSVLFDTLAVALAVDNRWVDVDEVRLEVTDDGWTRRSEEGTRVRAALRWVDREAYYDWLVDRLLR